MGDGRGAGGTGARGALAGGRQRRTGKPSYAQLEAALAAARQEIAGLTQLAEERARRLAEGLKQQRATADVLRVIASCPTDLQRVLDAIAERAARLCDATDAAIRRSDGGVSWLAAGRGPLRRAVEAANGWFRAPPPPELRAAGAALPLSRRTISGRAMVEGRTLHVADAAGDDEYPESQAIARRMGNHTTLCVPLTREGMSIGCILLFRADIRPFSEQQIGLLQTFADQAVIAIENARLFEELQERLEQQTATSEVLQVISRAPTDLQRVLDTIADSAARPCGTDRAMIVRVEGESYRPVAGRTTGDHRFTLESGLVVPPAQVQEYPVSRAIADGVVVHIPDLAAVPVEELPVPPLRTTGVRTYLAVPLLRQGTSTGAIILARREARPFTERQVALVQTFADQAVIALENARLFHELQEQLEQQTATSDILRVIASSPTDLQAVLDTIADSAARLCGTDRVAAPARLSDLGAGRNERLTMQGGCYLARVTHTTLFSKMAHPALDGAVDIGFRLVAVRHADAGL